MTGLPQYADHAIDIMPAGVVDGSRHEPAREVRPAGRAAGLLVAREDVLNPGLSSTSRCRDRRMARAPPPDNGNGSRLLRLVILLRL